MNALLESWPVLHSLTVVCTMAVALLRLLRWDCLLMEST